MRSLAYLVALPVLIAAVPAQSDLPRLVGTVGPGFTIDLADSEGKHVDAVTPATYELLVHDRSDIHNFVLANKNGTGFRVDTGVEFVGDKTFTIDLVTGLYGYACSPHFDTMNGRLSVIPATSPPVTSPQPVRTLTAWVGASVKLSRKRVVPGRYRVLVHDRSSVRNFHFRGPGVNLKTGKAFAGNVAWTVRLGRGTYRWGSDPRLTGRLIVR